MIRELAMLNAATTTMRHSTRTTTIFSNRIHFMRFSFFSSQSTGRNDPPSLAATTLPTSRACHRSFTRTCMPETRPGLP